MTHLRGIKPPAQRDSKALTRAPLAPKHLSDHAKAEWRRVMPGLIERGIITAGDLSGIENYCIAAGAVKQIADAMAGLAVPDLKLGGLQIRYAQTARQLAAEFGLTPTSRARVGGVSADDDDDELNPLMIGRNRTHA